MQKIKDFESFAAGYFSALGMKRVSADDIASHCIASRQFAAALSFYLFTNPYVLAKQGTLDKYKTVAKNIRKLIQD